MRYVKSLLILFVAVCLSRDVNAARILGLIPTNFLSHFTMFHEVMKSLADAGHQVDIVSHFPLKKPYPNYKDIVSLAGTIPINVNNMTLDYLDNLAESPAKFVVDIFGDRPCALLDQPGLKKLIKNPPTDPPYDLVIAEYFFAHCYFAFGRHLKVPLVGITSTRLVPHSNAALGNPVDTAFVFEIGDGSAFDLSFGQRFKNTLITSLMIHEAKKYTEVQTDIVKKYFGPDMPDIRELEKDVSLLLINSHHSLNGVRPLTPAIVEIGGVHVRDEETELPTELKSWLDESKDGFIYVSFGSMMKIESFPKKILADFYAAFSQLSPLRVLIKVANPNELPPALPKNVLTLSWVPQVNILKHKNIRTFVTHGGLLSLQEAVTFAVPLIGMPLFGDQSLNINNCVDRGVGLSLNYQNLTKEGLVAAINTVVSDPSYKKNMIALSAKFLDRPTKPRETAVFWIEYILKHGSDVLRSPAVNLTWWQLTLLDVYGSIIAALLLLLYIVKRISTVLFYGFIGNRQKQSLSKSKKQS